MKIFCLATLDNKAQLNNLCECIQIAGGTSKVLENDVSVDFEGTPAKCELIIKLFEHYHRHTIYSETDNPS